MDAYTDFASVYDIFMDETPYEEWASYLDFLIHTYGVSRPAAGQEDGDGSALSSEKNQVVELGCGTGTLTELMAAKGYDMTGIDSSAEMLAAACQKRDGRGSGTLYLLQDMREFELYGTAGTFLSVCDSVNYLLEEEDLLRCFRLVQNYLYPGGVFIFDFNTVYKYEIMIGDATIAENRDECSFIWENYYDRETRINEYDLTIFTRVSGRDGLYRRSAETHYQRGYTLDTMRRLVREAGLSFITAMDADTHGEAGEESGRVYVVAGKGRSCRNTAEEL